MEQLRQPACAVTTIRPVASRKPSGWGCCPYPSHPNYAEYIFSLMGRNVLADQMAFLRAYFPRLGPSLRRLVTDGD